MEEFPQTSGSIAYPDAAMRLAISRAVAVETSRGWRISKEKQSHKIDVVVVAEVDIAHIDAVPGCPLRNRCIEPVVADDVAGRRRRR